jgi:cyclic pyranopterin phosphate synthase
MSKLTHVNQSGEANMVDVTFKAESVRVAIAEGYVYMSDATITEVIEHTNMKGDVIITAKIAGIQGVKQCASLIPLCHPLALSKVDVSFEV